MSEKEAWAHVATRDGQFAGVIAATLDEYGPRSSDAENKRWKREIAKFCGDYIADGFTITTVYSREEYLALIDGMPMWQRPTKAGKKSTPADDLFAAKRASTDEAS